MKTLIYKTKKSAVCVLTLSFFLWGMVVSGGN